MVKRLHKIVLSFAVQTTLKNAFLDTKPNGNLEDPRASPDPEISSGTCYKAANWISVGTTKGRGKLVPSGKQSVPIKDLLIYPLDRDFIKKLTS